MLWGNLTKPGWVWIKAKAALGEEAPLLFSNNPRKDYQKWSVSLAMLISRFFSINEYFTWQIFTSFYLNDESAHLIEMSCVLSPGRLTCSSDNWRFF
jgi:hypothetical protein